MSVKLFPTVSDLDFVLLFGVLIKYVLNVQMFTSLPWRMNNKICCMKTIYDVTCKSKSCWCLSALPIKIDQLKVGYYINFQFFSISDSGRKWNLYLWPGKIVLSQLWITPFSGRNLQPSIAISRFEVDQLMYHYTNICILTCLLSLWLSLYVLDF